MLKDEGAGGKQRYLKQQGMMEPVFSQLIYRQGLMRFRLKGLKTVRCEFALHATAYNLSRAIDLLARDISIVHYPHCSFYLL